MLMIFNMCREYKGQIVAGVICHKIFNIDMTANAKAPISSNLIATVFILFGLTPSLANPHREAQTEVELRVNLG